mgnify:FL=1
MYIVSKKVVYKSNKIISLINSIVFFTASTSGKWLGATLNVGSSVGNVKSAKSGFSLLRKTNEQMLRTTKHKKAVEIWRFFILC